MLFIEARSGYMYMGMAFPPKNAYAILNGIIFHCDN